MAVSYKKLWKLLIDKDMKKKELEQQAKVSHYTVSKMYRGENVTIDILERICKTLNCSLDDIVEFVPDEEPANEHCRDGKHDRQTGQGPFENGGHGAAAERA